MIHKTSLENYRGTLQELATELGDLRYDALAVFLEELSNKIAVDGTKDRQRGRVQLATCLDTCAQQLAQSSKTIEKAWEICEPYMED